MDRFHCVDKEIRHHSVYLTTVLSIEFEIKNLEDRGVLVKWEVQDRYGQYYSQGNTVEELIDYFKHLTEIFELKSYSDKCFYKDQVLVYTNNPTKIYAFTQKYATDIFGENNDIVQFTLCDYFLITSSDPWTDETSLIGISMKMQEIMDTQFIPDKRVYISPAQRNRKTLRSYKISVPIDADYTTYYKSRLAYYGGISYARGKETITCPMIEYDRKSAYLYEFFMPVCNSNLIEADPESYTDFLDNTNPMGSIGTYQIKFKMNHRFINVYRKDCPKFEFNTVINHTFRFIDTDLRLFLKCVDIIEIKCIDLQIFNLGMMPKEYIEYIIKCFIEKENANAFEKDHKKRIANSNYGNLCRELNSMQFKELCNRPWYNPLWGLQITAYARQHIFEVGSKLQGWVYSDTDSIFCLKSVDNIRIIEEYNDQLSRGLKIACEMYNLDFDQISKLGLYRVEVDHIVKMIVRSTKTYAYKCDENGELISVASGMTKDAEKYNTEEIWSDFDKKLSYGNRKILYVNEDSCYEKFVTNIMDTPDLVEEEEEVRDDINVNEVIDQLRDYLGV